MRCRDFFPTVTETECAAWRQEFVDKETAVGLIRASCGSSCDGKRMDSQKIFRGRYSVLGTRNLSRELLRASKTTLPDEGSRARWRTVPPKREELW